ncbi:MAG: hypothetical protein QW404_03345 [Candidatus Nanoarchaeia archaeon]
MVRIAVEGLEQDIVPLISKIIEIGGYEVCYKNESSFLDDKSELVGKILDSNPDMVLLCNANGYLPFLKNYSKVSKVPILVLTGGGPDVVRDVKEYVPNVLDMPFSNFRGLYDKINQVLMEHKNK